MRVLLIAVIVLVSIRTVAAQTSSEPTETAPWDVAVMAAAYGGNPALPAERDFGDDWFATGAIAVVTGRHFTPHLKLELDVSATGDGRRWIERSINVAGLPSPIFYGAEHFTSVRSVTGSLVYQFLENQWAHPFVQVGVAIDGEREYERTFPQTVFVGSPRPGNPVVVAGGESARDTTVRARLLLGGGGKLYFTPRVFFRTDARAAFDRALRHLSIRAGLGVDF